MERIVTPAQSGPSPSVIALTVMFSRPGTPQVTTKSPRFTFREARRLVDIFVSAGTVGSSATTIAFYKNNTQFATVTLASGSASVVVVNSTPFAANDHLRVAATAVGTGVADIEVQARYS